MSMLVGKYESNATALRLALQYRYVDVRTGKCERQNKRGGMLSCTNFHWVAVSEKHIHKSHCIPLYYNHYFNICFHVLLPMSIAILDENTYVKSEWV